MMRLRFLTKFRRLLLLGALAVSACQVADYGMDHPYAGGYSEKELSPDLWSVTYRANDAATKDTLTTYWLYRAASLTLEAGYDGFRVVGGFPPLMAMNDEPPPYMVAAVAPMVFIVPNYEPKPMKWAMSTIRMLRVPLPAEPYRVFDAQLVKSVLEPIVLGPKCERNNVCPYEVRALAPEPPGAQHR